MPAEVPAAPVAVLVAGCGRAKAPGRWPVAMMTRQQLPLIRTLCERYD